MRFASTIANRNNLKLYLLWIKGAKTEFLSESLEGISISLYTKMIQLTYCTLSLSALIWNYFHFFYCQLILRLCRRGGLKSLGKDKYSCNAGIVYLNYFFYVLYLNGIFIPLTSYHLLNSFIFALSCLWINSHQLLLSSVVLLSTLKKRAQAARGTDTVKTILNNSFHSFYISSADKKSRFLAEFFCDWK